MVREVLDIVRNGVLNMEADVTLLPKIREAASRNPASVNERDEDDEYEDEEEEKYFDGNKVQLCMRVSAPTLGPRLPFLSLCGLCCVVSIVGSTVLWLMRAFPSQYWAQGFLSLCFAPCIVLFP